MEKRSGDDEQGDGRIGQRKLSSDSGGEGAMLVEICKTPWGCPGCTIEVTARAKGSSDTQTAFSCHYGSAGKGCE